MTQTRWHSSGNGTQPAGGWPDAGAWWRNELLKSLRDRHTRARWTHWGKGVHERKISSRLIRTRRSQGHRTGSCTRAPSRWRRETAKSQCRWHRRHTTFRSGGPHHFPFLKKCSKCAPICTKRTQFRTFPPAQKRLVDRLHSTTHKRQTDSHYRQTDNDAFVWKNICWKRIVVSSHH
jgi:hypothetical protein